MALFGGRADRSVEIDELESEIERLDRLPLPALAAAVMDKAFGPGAAWEDPEEEVTVGGSGDAAGATVAGIAAAMALGGSFKGIDERTRLRLQRLPWLARSERRTRHSSACCVTWLRYWRPPCLARCPPSRARK